MDTEKKGKKTMTFKAYWDNDAPFKVKDFRRGGLVIGTKDRDETDTKATCARVSLTSDQTDNSLLFG